MYLIIAKHWVVSTDKLHLLLRHHWYLIDLLCRRRGLAITAWLLHSLIEMLLMIWHSVSKIVESLWLRQGLYQILRTSDKDRWTLL